HPLRLQGRALPIQREGLAPRSRRSVVGHGRSEGRSRRSAGAAVRVADLPAHPNSGFPQTARRVVHLRPAGAVGQAIRGPRSFGVSGHNLKVWTKYGGADPEVNFNGVSTFNRNDSWTVPMTRRYSASLTVGF